MKIKIKKKQNGFFSNTLVGAGNRMAYILVG
jgi:hypothetical protein